MKRQLYNNTYAPNNLQYGRGGERTEGMGRKRRRGGGRGGEVDRQGFGVGSEACRKDLLSSRGSVNRLLQQRQVRESSSFSQIDTAVQNNTMS